MDDIFASIFAELNSFHSTIKLAYDLELYYKLALLDVCVTRIYNNENKAINRDYRL